MGQYRLSNLAKADIASILRMSAQKHGKDARIRYRGLLTSAMRRIARDPYGISTADRRYLGKGLRSLHIRHSRNQSSEAPVAAPVHVIFFRAAESGRIEIVRVLHQRMEPRGHLAAISVCRD